MVLEAKLVPVGHHCVATLNISPRWTAQQQDALTVNGMIMFALHQQLLSSKVIQQCSLGRCAWSCGHAISCRRKQ